MSAGEPGGLVSWMRINDLFSHDDWSSHCLKHNCMVTFTIQVGRDTRSGGVISGERRGSVDELHHAAEQRGPFDQGLDPRDRGLERA